MKKLVILFIITWPILSNAQQASSKPEYVIIINNKIVTESDVNAYAQKGYIKAMNKAISQQRRDELAKILGEGIGEREFIMEIELFSEEEMAYRTARDQTKPAEPKKPLEEFKVSANQSVPVFTANMSDGTMLKINDLKGKVVLIDFWATWCAPCLMELYDLPEAILDPLKDEPFVLLPVAIGEPEERVRKRLKKFEEDGISLTTALDPQKEIWSLFAEGSIPKAVLIDKKGVIQVLTEGYAKGDLSLLLKEIQLLLEE